MIAASDSTIGIFMAGSWTILGDNQTRPTYSSAWKVADARIGFCRMLSCKGKRTPVRPLTQTIEFVPNRDEMRPADLSCESVGTASKFSQASDLIFEEKTADPSSLCRDSAVRPVFFLVSVFNRP